MKLLGFSILLVLTLLPDALSLPDRKRRSSTTNDAPIVDLGYAQYQGVFDDNTNTTGFFGVRYAAPPVGEYRWQAPQAPANVPGVQKADTLPPPCHQSGVNLLASAPANPDTLNSRQLPPPAESEDCLFLNVYYPGSTNPASNGTLLPTVVWIHGGGYILGSSTIFTGPGSDLIRESNDGVVVVIIQYRLGIFGFLAGNEVKENGALNAGLLDQNFALRWVSQHISKFGGDPTKVTIWGESAGAGSVVQHIIAEDGETTPPLFRGAITSSAFLPPQYAFNDTIPQTIYNQVVDQTNCTSTSDTLACLREVDTSILQTTNNQINTGSFFGTFPTVPVIDGTFIRRRATEAFRQGKLNGNALLSFTNADEGFIFVNQSAPLNASFFASQVFPKLGPKETSAIEEAYGDLGSTINQNSLIMGEAIFLCPTWFLLRAFQNRSFKGEFAIPPGIHALDVDYYFPTSIPSGGGSLSFNNATFISSFAGSFLSFVVSLDPNIKVDPINNITPEWPVYKGEEMRFNRTEYNTTDIRLVTTDEALLERCRLWESFGNLTGQ